MYFCVKSLNCIEFHKYLSLNHYNNLDKWKKICALNKGGYMNLNNSLDSKKTTDGKIWIKNKKVYVENELSGGIPPAIIPRDEIEVEINGKKINRLTVVSEKDNIKVMELETKQEEKMEIEVSEDKQYAYINYESEVLYKNILNDSQPDNMLEFTIKNEALKKTNLLTREKILNSLKKENVIYGINDEKIDEICNSKDTPISTKIATGKKPIDPIEDRIQFLYKDTEKENDCKIGEESIFDSSKKNEKGVETGDIIAIVYKGKKGESGISVIGDNIEPKPYNELNVKTNSSVSFENETGKVIAKRSGTVHEEYDDRNTISFEIIEEVVLDEVSIKSGNIFFNGNIRVDGNVYEKMKVESKNSIFIKGTVNFSEIYALNNVDIRGGLITSKVISGAEYLLLKDPIPVIIRIIKELNELIKNINRIFCEKTNKQNIQFNNTEFNHILNSLLSTENKNLPVNIYRCMQELKSFEYNLSPEKYEHIVQILKPYLIDSSMILNISFIDNTLNELKNIFATKKEKKIEGSIILEYVLNSTVESYGDIIVSGQGVFNSNLTSKKTIRVMGVVKSGTIVANELIEVRETGSNMGIKTLIKVNEEGKVRIKVAHPDTIIKIGNKTHKFINTEYNIYARIEELELKLT